MRNNELDIAYGMDCTLECMHGSCEIGKADFSVFDKYNTHHNLPFANITHVDMMYCKCTEGYTGVTCEIKYDSCNSDDSNVEQQQHACFHGARCVEVASALGTLQYRCDCMNIDEDEDGIINQHKVYAGLYCEYPATSTCEFGTSFSKNSFCTNGGSCVTSIVTGQSHEGCRCTDGYSGHHCEYNNEHSLGVQIDSVSTSMNTQSSSSVSTNTMPTTTPISATTSSSNSILSASSIMKKGTTTSNTTVNETNELGATIMYCIVMVLCLIILINIFIIIRKIKKGDDPFLTTKDRDIQHATQMNINDDLALEEREDKMHNSEIELAKENEIL